MKNVIMHFVKYLIYKKITNISKKTYDSRILKIMKLNNIPVTEVKGEMTFVEKWKLLSKEVNTNYYRCYSHYIGKNPNILPEDICCNIIEPILDPCKYRGFYDDKNMFERILPPDFLPLAIIRKIRGHYYTKDYLPVHISSDEELMTYFAGYNKIVVKPSVDTESGRGVIVFTMNVDGTLKNNANINLSLNFLDSNYQNDFIIQECLKQHPALAVLNPSSINTLRICTYRSVKTDEIIVTNIALRVGKNGSDVDNIHAGGIVFGVDKDGLINSYGSNHWGQTFQQFNGIDYSKQKLYIPELPTIISFAKEVANRIIHHRLLALDIMLNENGHPKLLEYNIGGFSAWLFQFNTGSIFGEYTDEVIEYCSRHLDEADYFIKVSRK